MIVEPLVSVIMNCFNSSAYLQEAIESVIDQTYKNFEIIFWDNQSIDNSAAIFKSYCDPRLKYFYAPEHKKLSTARNLAIQKASGEIIAFLDCDDIWLPHKLEEQVAGFSLSNDVGVVYSASEFLMQSDSDSAEAMLKAFSRFQYHQHGPRSIYDALLRANFIIFSSVLIKKSVFDSVNGFTDEFKHNEDYEVLLKCSGISLAVCTQSKVLKYRIHGRNNSYANLEIAYLENRAIFNELKPTSAVKNAININDVRYLIYRFERDRKLKYLQDFLSVNALKGLIGLTKRYITFARKGISNID